MMNVKSIENMSFEEAMSELEEIVRQIDNGSQNLETAVASFERGIILKKHCEKMLNEAKLKIDKITKNSEGETEIVEADI